MAEICLGLGEKDKGIELLKKHNAGGLYNAKIGHTLAACERMEEAARASLQEARRLAAFFDAAPSYNESDIRCIGLFTLINGEVSERGTFEDLMERKGYF